MRVSFLPRTLDALISEEQAVSIHRIGDWGGHNPSGRSGKENKLPYVPLSGIEFRSPACILVTILTELHRLQCITNIALYNRPVLYSLRSMQ